MAKKEGRDGESRLVGKVTYSVEPVEQIEATKPPLTKEAIKEHITEEYDSLPPVRDRTQAEIDLDILAEAHVIRQDGNRFRAAKSISCGIDLG